MTKSVRRFLKPRYAVQLCLALFFLFCVVAPIVSMFSRITPEGFRNVLSSPQFLPAVKNSLLTGLTATVISLLLSLAAAFAVERSRIRCKALFSTLLVLPMLIPSISHAFGLVALFGKSGLLTELFHLDLNIYGFTGIVMGSVLYAFPVSFLMFSGILRYEDGLPYKAAEVLGIPGHRRFLGITLPYLRGTVISAFFAIFTMIVTDYGVPLMVGGKTTTLSVLMYNYAVGRIDYGSGSVIGSLLLLPAVAAFLIDLIYPENSGNSFIAEPVQAKKSVLRDAAAYFYCAFLSLGVILPVASFAIMVFERKYPFDPTFTLEHIKRSIERGADGYLLNSLLYSLLAALLGTLLAFVCAYLTARGKSGEHGGGARGLHLAAITTMAIPGIVLGLSYVIFFHSTPIYGTVFLIVLANSVHFFSSPYLMMYNTLGKLNPNLESVGESLGVRRFFIIKDVILPKVKYTAAECFVYFFVNSMMTISAVSFLAPPAPKPVALMINQFEAQRLMECAAFISLLILAVNLIMKGAAALFSRVGKGRQSAG